ncbi:hypothetical protein GGR55DRAFT_488850 [Xylaria sp. FL0064]|nr:hypothetical protein GGR55DRAFT_488850 [Xylaria sp. FL0064]
MSMIMLYTTLPCLLSPPTGNTERLHPILSFRWWERARGRGCDGVGWHRNGVIGKIVLPENPKACSQQPYWTEPISGSTQDGLREGCHRSIGVSGISGIPGIGMGVPQYRYRLSSLSHMIYLRWNTW